MIMILAVMIIINYHITTIINIRWLIKWCCWDDDYPIMMMIVLSDDIKPIW